MNPAQSDATKDSFPAIMTWRAPDASRMESVRVQLSGNRIKANGRIVAAAGRTHPAFGVYYDLQTDETGATKRLGMTVTRAERERQLALARDDENMWLITDHRGETRAGFEGALDADVVFSPFFNTLPIRRCRLYERADTVTLSIVYVSLPDMAVDAATLTYTSSGAGNGNQIKLQSPAADTTLTVDADGFIVDYPGLAERI